MIVCVLLVELMRPFSLTPGTTEVRRTMHLLRLSLLLFAFAVPSGAAAQTMNFERATEMLAASCGNDIDNVCRGVNLDPVRLKECLRRNDDTISPTCRNDYQRALGAIDERVTARSRLSMLCNWEMKRLCGEVRQDQAKGLQCLLDSTKKATPNCNKAITAAGYR
jgi:hypothetical protein